MTKGTKTDSAWRKWVREVGATDRERSERAGIPIRMVRHLHASRTRLQAGTRALLESAHARVTASVVAP